MKRRTPGPWKLVKDDIYGLCIRPEIPFGPIPIAVVKNCDDEELEGNAALLAAAPELLAVCKLILKEWEAPTDGVQKGELIARLSQYSLEARAAINKAEGRND